MLESEHAVDRINSFINYHTMTLYSNMPHRPSSFALTHFQALIVKNSSISLYNHSDILIHIISYLTTTTDF